MRLIKEFELIVKDQTFGEKCIIKAQYALGREAGLLEKLELLKALNHTKEVIP
jgi:hypothetical protein